jgi:hypothetical protein
MSTDLPPGPPPTGPLSRRFTGPSTSSGLARASTIKGWVRDHLSLDDTTTVVVSELTCAETDCPPIETVIAVMDTDGTRKVTIHKPLAEITGDDVAAALHPDGT